MRVHNVRHASIFLAFLFLPSTYTGATTVLQMNLEHMSAQAELIVRGTIIDVRETRVQTGGGELPALRYQVHVHEAFKGEVSTAKDVQTAEFMVVGTLKKLEAGEPVIAGWPELLVGNEYLLFVAPPGPIGLTSTIGLGQGCFDILSIDKEEMALNGFDNVGLFKGMDSGGLPQSGPIPYSDLADQIHAQLGY